MSGTSICGSCGSTLGCRKCPEGHASPLISDHCVVCGSSNLTPGTSILNLRPVVVIIVAFVLYKLLPSILSTLRLQGWIDRVYWYFLNQILTKVIVYALAALFVGWCLGPHALSVIQGFWVGVLRLCLDAVLTVGKWLLSVIAKFLFRKPPGGSK